MSIPEVVTHLFSHFNTFLRLSLNKLGFGVLAFILAGLRF